MTQRWLAVIGIGEDGIVGLSELAKQRISGAEIVFGGARHLSLAAPLIQGQPRRWPSPFELAVPAVLAERGRRVCVLASGDPFCFGMGATLSGSIAPEEMDVLPAPSAFSLAAARLGWPLQDIAMISLHGRPLDLIRPLLHPKARILALTSDETGPRLVAHLLERAGFGRSRLTLLEALGGPRERIRRLPAVGFALEGIEPLNLCAIEVEADAGARILPFSSGLREDLFEHDGQITKREIRTIALAHLAPCHGQLLWDIGAGSGSVGIEWMLSHPSLRAIAIEEDFGRAARIRRNAMAFGVPGLAVIEGAAPGAIAGLPAPDAIFIGGGGSVPGVLDAAIAALKPDGALVVNAVTLETERVVLEAERRLGGSLSRIDIARASPVGGMRGWRPAMPVLMWCWQKPGRD